MAQPSQPSLVTVSSSILAEHHRVIHELVAITANIVEAPLAQCEIHVKYSKRRLYGKTTGYAYYTYDGRPWSEQPNAGAVRMNVAPHINTLVTIKLYHGYVERYADPTVHGPQVLHYARYKTAPYTQLYTWHEELVYLLAHEIHHIAQFNRPRKANGRAHASELECEAVAVHATMMYRQITGLMDALANPPAAHTLHAARR